MGFRKPLEVSATVRRWLTAATIRSLRGEFARSQFAELVPVLLRPFGARRRIRMRRVDAFDRFLAGLQARRRACSRCCGKIRTWSR